LTLDKLRSMLEAGLMKKIGILFHPQIPAAEALARDLGKSLAHFEASGWLCSAWDEGGAKEKAPGTDLILSIGGDGTMLRAARVAAPFSIPILGINLGHLGFMIELTAEEVWDKIPQLLAGEGWLDERAMLEARLLSREGSFHALNDVVVARGGRARVIRVQVTIDGEPLTVYKSDGVIVATATGSTGYSLAAGGPILHPRAKELLLTPISSHLSLATPLVLSPETVLVLEIRADEQALLSVDGQIEVKLGDGDLVEVKRSPYVTRLLRTQPPAFFYRTLAERLGRK
jgi:NAD+ kinase